MPATQITVTTAATLLRAADQGAIMFRNRGSVAVYVDTASGVTSANGFQVDAGETVSIEQRASNPFPVYAIAASGSQRVDLIILGL